MSLSSLCGLKCFWIKRTSMKIYVKTVLYFDSYQKKIRLTTQCLHAMRGSILNCSWLPNQKWINQHRHGQTVFFSMCFCILFVFSVVIFETIYDMSSSTMLQMPLGNQKAIWSIMHIIKSVSVKFHVASVKLSNEVNGFMLLNSSCRIYYVNSLFFVLSISRKKDTKISITWLTVCQIESLLPLIRCDL